MRSPAELPKGSVPGAFFRKVGKPEFAKATPAARHLSWLLLGVGDTSEQALAVCGPLTAGRFACPAGYSGLSGAIAPGADKPRLRPFSRLTRGGSSDLSPYVIPTSAWRDRIGRTPVRLEGDRLTKPAPLFAAQPSKVFRRSLFSKRLERSRLRFFGIPFLKKGMRLF